MARLSPDIEEQIDRALAMARDYLPYEVASSVRYMPSEDLLLIVLKSGERCVIPIENIQGLADADRKAVADFELAASGSFIHWEKLDVDFGIKGLADGLYGNERWMKRLHEKRKTDAVAIAALSRTA